MVAAMYMYMLMRVHDRKKEHTLENLAGSDIVLTATDVSEINEAIAKHEVKGDRYFGSDEAAHLWG